MRLFLALWLVVFAVQTSEVLAVVLPDDCVEYSTDSTSDPCPDGCARCVCCARVPIFVPDAAAPAAAEPVAAFPAPPPVEKAASAEPRGIFHVPRSR